MPSTTRSSRSAKSKSTTARSSSARGGREARRAREKENHGFDWGDGIVLALVGAATILSVEKSLSKREEHKDKEDKEDKAPARDDSRDNGGRRLRGSSTWAYDREYDDDRRDRYDDDAYYDDDRYDRYYEDERHRPDRYDHDRYYADRSARRGSW